MSAENQALDFFEQNHIDLVRAGMPLHLMEYYFGNREMLSMLLADPGPGNPDRFIQAAQERCYERLELEAEALFASYEPIDRFWICAVAILYQMYRSFPSSVDLHSGEIADGLFMRHVAKSDSNATTICFPVLDATLDWLVAEGFIKGERVYGDDPFVLMKGAKLTVAGLALLASPFREPLELHQNLADFFRAVSRGREADPTLDFMEKFYRALGSLLSNLAMS